MAYVDAGSGPAATIAREIEKLKRRVIWAERAGSDRGRRISFLYRVADTFGRRVFPLSFCRGETRSSFGCNTGHCCQCGPDVFEYERDVLELLPKRVDQTGYCPFFNLSRKNCGIYAVRPFACRVYFNLGSSSYYCQSPNDMTLDLFASVRPHLEKVLGPYTGGFTHSRR